MFYALLSALIVFVVLLVCLKTRHDDFYEKFPAISDEEFLARCKPGTNPQVALKVRRIVSDNLGIDYEHIHPSANFIEDLGAD